jgi:LruC domain-containing protein
VSETFSITLISGIELDNLEWLPPYNPFLQVNSDNAKEVHLPDYPPTDNADPSYFQTEDDDTMPGEGRYYKTINNLPWAICMPQNWYYPLERDEISWGYLQFPDWAESGGSVNDEWYFFLDDRTDDDYIYVPE